MLQKLLMILHHKLHLQSILKRIHTLIANEARLDQLIIHLLKAFQLLPPFLQLVLLLFLTLVKDEKYSFLSFPLQDLNEG